MSNTLRPTDTLSDAEPTLDVSPEDRVLAALLPKLQDPSLRPALRQIARAWFNAWAEPLDDPDAELIALCDEYAAQLRKIRDLGSEIPDNDEREKTTMPLYRQLDQLDHRISAIRAHTLDGIRAKARHIALSLPDVLEEPDPGIDNAFFASILRDLLEGEIVA
jgi:hypothetical protein